MKKFITRCKWKRKNEFWIFIQLANTECML